MSGIALLADLTGRCPSRGERDALLARMAHRGPDGEDRYDLSWSALGVRVLGATSDLTAGLASTASPDGRVHLAFDGRLDNRSELTSRLDGSEGRWGDGRLALAAYLRWGEGCFETLRGPFAIVVVDEVEAKVLCARDLLGDRTLFYAMSGGQIRVASEETALLADPGVSGDLDEETVARYFAALPPEPGRTFFQGVREVPPGCLVRFDAGGVQLRTHSVLTPGPPRRYRCDREYVDEYRTLLEQSVRRCMRCVGPPVVMMSGGLDSTAIAALAARELEARGETPLPVVCWQFDELSLADERPYMDAMAESCRLRVEALNGDGDWPLRDLASWPRNPSAPLESVFRRLQDRTYRAARAGGSRTVLTGNYGDQLYAGGFGWLSELIAAGRPLRAARLFVADCWARLRRRPGAAPRAALLELAGRGPMRSAECIWLTERGRVLVDASDAASGASLPPDVLRPAQWRSVADPQLAQAATLEQSSAARAGVEVWTPYRDRDLLEFMLAVPADQLYRPGWTRWVHREAMKGVLPEAVRRRRRPSTLFPLTVRGLAEREVATVREVLWNPEALWPRYVRRQWMQSGFPREMVRGRDGLSSFVAWRCVTFELWRGGLEKRAEAA